MKSNLEIITKAEGAERLLRTAVDIFFSKGDLLSAHVLSTAAHEVLHVLLKSQGKKLSFMKDNPVVRQDMQKKYHDIIHETQNFLKHAARDPSAKLEYASEETAFWIFDSILLFYNLTGGLKYRTFALFVLWFKIEHYEVLEENAFEMFKNAGVSSDFVKANYKRIMENPKQSFLANLL